MTSHAVALSQGTPCDCCDSNRYRPVLRGFDQRVGILTEFQLYECQECHLISLQPQPDSARLAQHYPDWLWQNEIGQSQISRAKFKPVLDLLNRRQPARGRLLDVGCGPGGFVAQAQQAGWEAHGIEVSLSQVQFAQSHGLPVSLCEDFMAYTSAVRFQAIVFNHVLEHVPSPKGYLKQALRLLSLGGLLVIAVPNYASVSRLLFRQYWTHLDLPRHVFQYTPHSLSRLIESAEGRVLDVCFHDRVQNSLGARDSARRWIQQGMLRLPVKVGATGLSQWGTVPRRSSLKRWPAYIYRAYGELMAITTEAIHLADTFIMVATSK